MGWCGWRLSGFVGVGMGLLLLALERRTRTDAARYQWFAGFARVRLRKAVFGENSFVDIKILTRN